MKKLLITLMLVSPFSFADWGDVYYCQMTTFLEVSLEGKMTDYKLYKFQFKLDKTKNAMVFGKASHFSTFQPELREGYDWPSQETFHADVKYAHFFFEKSKFLYSTTGMRTGMTVISADCDKF